MNKVEVKRNFIFQLKELIVQQGFSLSETLEIMKKDKAAKYFLDELEKGNSFSNAMVLCPYIKFDKTSVSFFCFAEKSGKLDIVIKYLSEKFVREKNAHDRISEALIYPLFVVILAILLLVFLIFYCRNFIGENDLIKAESYNPFFSMTAAMVFLLSFCIATFFYIKKIFSSCELYEAFVAVSVLSKSGFSLAASVGIAINVLGSKSKNGKLFVQAKERLAVGMNLKNAFRFENWNIPKKAKQEIENIIFFSKNSDEENRIFEKIAESINKEREKQRRLCLKLIEPVFITGTGIFLIIFLLNLVMPILGGISI